MSGVEQARVDPACRGFRNAVNGVGLLPPQANLDDTGIILDKLTNGFPPETPEIRQISDAVMPFEGSVLNEQSRHN